MPETNHPPTFYECSCPDFRKEQTFVLNTSAFSKSITRNWSDSNAGIGEGQYCKHIWTVKRLRDDLKKSEIPNDYPVPPADKPDGDLQYPERYQEGYKGNDFSGNWGIRGI